MLSEDSGAKQVTRRAMASSKEGTGRCENGTCETLEARSSGLGASAERRPTRNVPDPRQQVSTKGHYAQTADTYHYSGAHLQRHLRT